MNNKKAAGVGQVFMFIIAALTFALILIFGYKAVGTFLSRGEQVEFISFKNDLENSIKRIYTDFGTVRIEEFYPPAKYEQVCLVDMDYHASDAEMQQLCQQDQAACAVWASAQAALISGSQGYESVDENVFLRPVAGVSMKVFHIKFGNGGFLCQPIRNGKFSLQLEGKGSYTLLSFAT